MKKADLPQKLKDLVSWSVSLLGQSIKEEYGKDMYRQIERTRRQMKKLRGGDPLKWEADLRLLKKEYQDIGQLNEEQKLIFAHCYTCMLELVNRCESAYRTYRLGDRDLSLTNNDENKWIIFVLTAHPTEARAPEFLAVFGRIMEILVDALWEGEEGFERELYHLLRIILKVPIARSEKPKVADEAQNIYNFALAPDIVELLVKARQAGTNVMFRTWVGGDKDGHPGVDEKTMLESFSLSRWHLLIYLRRKLHKVKFELDVMKDLAGREQFMQDFQSFMAILDRLESLQPGDGELVVHFRRQVTDFKKSYEEAVSLDADVLQDVLDLIWLFPALVLPLEIREDSAVVTEALNAPENFAIGRMLAMLREVSRGNEPKWYVRGFVLSMCEKVEDIYAGIDLSKKVLGEQSLPVVPLFETELALQNGSEMLTRLYGERPEVVALHQSKWGSRFEVMLGYSDSSKESGVFPSRLLISQAMKKLDETIFGHRLTPVFFHGSGGSVERGGGSIQEQTEWWPKSAVDIFKATVQGEMVARAFASPEIFAGQIQKISDQWKVKRPARKPEAKPVVKEFSQLVQQYYQKTVHDPEFLQLVEKASPYMFLSELKIGSRPTKRTSELKVGGLRAIPWILCWTQTRVLFPTWWGVGSAWKSFDKERKELFYEQHKKSNLLASYIKLLGFTLEKVELAVWRLYLEESDLPRDLVDRWFADFLEEYALSLKFFHQVTGKKNLLWHRPWLGKSIELRSPMIHPLNLLQLMAVRNGDGKLLRKTVTGIACGMLTTG